MHGICILSNLIVYLYIKSLEPAATDKRRYIMTAFQNTKFISTFQQSRFGILL